MYYTISIVLIRMKQPKFEKEVNIIFFVKISIIT